MFVKVHKPVSYTHLDTKVKRLKNKFGMEDCGVFHFIVNEIYRVCLLYTSRCV